MRKARGGAGRRAVFITGTSSGIGKATAIRFSLAGWDVAATMRDPERAGDLRDRPGVRLYALDVTDNDSVIRARDAAVQELGRIDVVVNNAGFGVDGIFEAMDDATILRQFDTNVFGVMRVSRAFIPHFREQGGGTLIQVASMGGRLAFPLYSIYHGTKWAVEGFSESLHYELEPFGIRVKLIEPGAIRTEFYGAGRKFVTSADLPMYEEYVARMERVSQGAGANGEAPELVADAILRAASDGRRTMRYPVGRPAPLLLALRRWLPESILFRMIKRSYGS